MIFTRALPKMTNLSYFFTPSCKKFFGGINRLNQKNILSFFPINMLKFNQLPNLKSFFILNVGVPKVQSESPTTRKGIKTVWEFIRQKGLVL